jgi:hypothetical protein
VEVKIATATSWPRRLPVFERCFLLDKCCSGVLITLPFGKVEDMVRRPVREC